MPIRWGVLGTGRMARSMTAAIRAEGGEVLAVASSDAARAAECAAELGIPHADGPHHALLERADDLDVVYVATTHDRHHADALACIRAGLPVLVEKAFTLDLPQAEEVVAAARAAGVFAMEAMWMRFQPIVVEAERRVARGDIGEPRIVQADFGFVARPDPARRWLAPELGGGALLDVGVYPLTFVTSVLGAPTEARAVGELAPTGVDSSTSVAMRHGPGRLSSWTCSLAADTGVEATIGGTEGNIRVHGPFHHGAQLSVRRRSEVLDSYRPEGVEAGLHHEVAEVHRCLAAGERESPRMPLDLTLTTMRWLDEVRRQVGVAFPHEQADRPAAPPAGMSV